MHSLRCIHRIIVIILYIIIIIFHIVFIIINIIADIFNKRFYFVLLLSARWFGNSKSPAPRRLMWELRSPGSWEINIALNISINKPNSKSTRRNTSTNKAPRWLQDPKEILNIIISTTYQINCNNNILKKLTILFSVGSQRLLSFPQYDHLLTSFSRHETSKKLKRFL